MNTANVNAVVATVAATNLRITSPPMVELTVIELDMGGCAKFNGTEASRQLVDALQQTVNIRARAVHRNTGSQQPAAFRQTQPFDGASRVKISVPHANAIRPQLGGRVGCRVPVQRDRYGGCARARGEVRTPDAHAGPAANLVMIRLRQ